MTTVYIHAVNPHYSGPWADFAFSENGRWHWMVCSTKYFPTEPEYNFGCLICAETLAVAIDSAKKLRAAGGCKKYEVIHPVGTTGKPARDGEVTREYLEYVKNPKRFDNLKYDPQKLRKTFD